MVRVPVYPVRYGLRGVAVVAALGLITNHRRGMQSADEEVTRVEAASQETNAQSGQLSGASYPGSLFSPPPDNPLALQPKEIKKEQRMIFIIFLVCLGLVLAVALPTSTATVTLIITLELYQFADELGDIFMILITRLSKRRTA